MAKSHIEIWGWVINTPDRQALPEERCKVCGGSGFVGTGWCHECRHTGWRRVADAKVQTGVSRIPENDGPSLSQHDLGGHPVVDRGEHERPHLRHLQQQRGVDRLE